MTTCLSFIRITASATRCGSSSSKPNGFAVVTAQNPHARVQRSPAIMNVAVPWLQHSHLFGHCALSQTVCSRRSEISALVEKKTGFDGNRTLIQGGLCAWCSAGSIFAQDMSKKLTQRYGLEKLRLRESGRVQWSDISGHFGNDIVTLDRSRYRLLGRGRFSRKHHFEAGRFPVAEHSDVNPNDVRNCHQLFIMIAKHGVDVALGRRRITLGHVVPATDQKHCDHQ